MTTHPTDLRQQPGVCQNCDGTGKLHGTNPCRACNGTGQQPGVCQHDLLEPNCTVVVADADPFVGHCRVCDMTWTTRMPRTGQQPAQPESGGVRRKRTINPAWLPDAVKWLRGLVELRPADADGVRADALLEELDRLQLALATLERANARMRAKLLELAGECAECGGSGETTIRGMCGGVEMDCDNQPCPQCEHIREAAR